jgi:hypothetical protein
MGESTDAKRCSACGQIKAAKEFTTARRMKSGLSSACKVCFNVYRAEWTKNHPEKNAEYKRRKNEKEKNKGRKGKE